MKRMRVFIANISFVAGLSASALLGASVSAATTSPSLQCPVQQGNVEVVRVDLNTDTCDLAIDKQVSVNGGTFVEADTAGDAAQAHVGDTVTWKVTVTNNSGDLQPYGVVYVKDVLPAGVTFVNYVATDGTYLYNDGSPFENNWILPSQKSVDETLASTLPATLTITTTANATGLVQNTAAFNKYDEGHCDGGCAYQDADADNDSNDAWVNIQTKPQVLGDSTVTPQVLGLTNTGSGTGASIAAGSLLAITLAIAGYGRLYRRPKHYKI
jgi:uncharacterized repeat protein (TIGR01451 family)